MLYIVGAGICEGDITLKAIEVIKSADVIYGSRKILERVTRFSEMVAEREIEDFSEETYRKIAEESRQKNVVVVSSGDPMVAGMGKVLKKFCEFEVVPGISSVQKALAIIGADLTDVVVVDAHAKDPKNLLEMLKFRDLLILADRQFKLDIFGDRDVLIIENICMDNKRVRAGKAGDLEIESDYTIVYVRR